MYVWAHPGPMLNHALIPLCNAPSHPLGLISTEWVVLLSINPTFFVYSSKWGYKIPPSPKSTKLAFPYTIMFNSFITLWWYKIYVNMNLGLKFILIWILHPKILPHQQGPPRGNQVPTWVFHISCEKCGRTTSLRHSTLVPPRLISWVHSIPNPHNTTSIFMLSDGDIPHLKPSINLQLYRFSAHNSNLPDATSILTLSNRGSFIKCLLSIMQVSPLL